MRGRAGSPGRVPELRCVRPVVRDVGPLPALRGVTHGRDNARRPCLWLLGGRVGAPVLAPWLVPGCGARVWRGAVVLVRACVCSRVFLHDDSSCVCVRAVRTSWLVGIAVGLFPAVRAIGSDGSALVGVGRLASGGRVSPVAVRAVCGCSRAWAILWIPGRRFGVGGVSSTSRLWVGSGTRGRAVLYLWHLWAYCFSLVAHGRFCAGRGVGRYFIWRGLFISASVLAGALMMLRGGRALLGAIHARSVGVVALV